MISDLSSVRVYSSVHWTSHDIQGTRKNTYNLVSMMISDSPTVQHDRIIPESEYKIDVNQMVLESDPDPDPDFGIS